MCKESSLRCYRKYVATVLVEAVGYAGQIITPVKLSCRAASPVPDSVKGKDDWTHGEPIRRLTTRLLVALAEGKLLLGQRAWSYTNNDGCRIQYYKCNMT